MRGNAEAFVQITRGTLESKESRLALAGIAAPRLLVMNPLIMAMLEDYAEGAWVCSHDDLIAMLRTVGSFPFWRMVCNVASNSLNKFIPSLIKRLRETGKSGGNYREAFEAILLSESGRAWRIPVDKEFEQVLIRRHSCSCPSFYMLAKLENSHHSKDERDFSAGTYTIGHDMPRNALNQPEWMAMLGDDH
ncbi:hypothetical protein [Bifidobacterium xylocopae]|uniref:Uncharacterized protein n=1 Tax=Bifidobacterium xylocopae TaxID=2493119 RepID=A0A366KDL7_9BIFI|nr:hypothetical protein [Bifidobacterium xylocopae]RBP99826.1 hypothetical protein CRD59_01990 [Bifidobacterium xylocopae]